MAAGSADSLRRLAQAGQKCVRHGLLVSCQDFLPSS
jgi:hypothetical protein